MAIIDLITLLQLNLPLILPVSLNIVIIFLGVRQARAGTHSVELSSTEGGTSQPRPQATRFKRPTIRELEDLIDPPGWTGRRFYKINRHIRLFIKMLTDLEKHSIALQRLSPTLIDNTVFDNLIWEVCLTKGFLFDEFTVNAYVEHYLSEEEPDTKLFQSLYSSKLVTHRIVCLPRRGSEIEGAWGVNDNFSFEYFHNGISVFESRKTRLPLDFFWCWINDELMCPKVADCHFFIEQIDPNRRFVRIGMTYAFSTEQLLNGYHEDSDSYSDSDDSDSDESDSDDEI